MSDEQETPGPTPEEQGEWVQEVGSMVWGLYPTAQLVLVLPPGLETSEAVSGMAALALRMDPIVAARALRAVADRLEQGAKIERGRWN